MTRILQFLGTVDVADDDDYGKINLKLALDLLVSVRAQASEEVVEGKARNIIMVCCEPMFDDLIEAYDWNPDEIAYADHVIAQCIEVATFDLLEIAKRCITHKRKHERRTKLRIEDMKLAGLMAYIMDVHNKVSDQLENTFLEEHGSMYFSS